MERFIARLTMGGVDRFCLSALLSSCSTTFQTEIRSLTKLSFTFSGCSETGSDQEIRLSLRRKCQRQQRFLFYFVRFGAAGGGAGAGAAFYRENVTIAGNALQAREHVE
jgi:hypothetical protein